MPSFNSATLVGHLGNKPELTVTASGKQVANCSLAVKDFKKEKPDWFKLTFWGKAAENASQFLDKGSPVLVQGPVSLEEYIDKNGENRANQTVTVLNFQMLGGSQAPKGENKKAIFDGDDDGPF